MTVALGGSTSNSINITGTQTYLWCDGRSLTQSIDGTQPDDGVGMMVSGLPILVPDPRDPGHYTGRATIIHREEPRIGGSKVTDAYVEWDLRRRPR